MLNSRGSIFLLVPGAYPRMQRTLAVDAASIGRKGLLPAVLLRLPRGIWLRQFLLQRLLERKWKRRCGHQLVLFFHYSYRYRRRPDERSFRVSRSRTDFSTASRIATPITRCCPAYFCHPARH